MHVRHGMFAIWMLAAGCAVDELGTEGTAVTSHELGAVRTARVLDRFAPIEVIYAPGGAPAVAEVITFEVPAEGATAWFDGGAEVLTDERGVATIQPTACAIAGEYTLVARAGTTTFASVTLRNLPDAPAAVYAVGGTAQRAEVGAAFAQPLVARVLDTHGNPVPGIEVSFTPPSAGASAILSAPVAITDETGHARVEATANEHAGLYTVELAAAGQPVTGVVLMNTAPPAVLDHPWQGLDPAAQLAW